MSVHRGQLPVAEGGAAPDATACAASDVELLRTTLESFEIKDYDMFAPHVSTRPSGGK